MDTLSDYLHNGTEVWANCEALSCPHGAPLDLKALIDHPKVGDVTVMALKIWHPALRQVRIAGRASQHPAAVAALLDTAADCESYCLRVGMVVQGDVSCRV